SAQLEAPPLRQEPDGSIRIGQTRVLLDLVIRAFQDGATPETIVQQYTSVSLAEAYSVIGYYLRHRQEIDDYLQAREVAAEEARPRVEAMNGDMSEIRARLQAARQK